MREILFRGKSKHNGEWIYGQLFSQDDVVTILPYPVNIGTGFSGMWWIDDGFEPVDPETVGQFTGLYDSTEWEDLTPEEQQAFLHQPDGWENTPDVWHGKQVFEGDIFKTACEIGVIRFREDYAVFGFEIWWRGFPDDFLTYKDYGKRSFVIIGNVHDNPELLEVK